MKSKHFGYLRYLSHSSHFVALAPWDLWDKCDQWDYIPLVISGSAIVSSGAPTFCTNSTSRHSDCSSRTSTLKLSGKPGSKSASPLTIASYILDRPATSSDFAVNNS